MNGADDTGTLVAPEVSRVCVRWGGQEDGMSSDHSDLQLHSPRTGGGGGGGRLLQSPAGVYDGGLRVVCEGRSVGALIGRVVCVTMKGVLWTCGVW